MTANPTPQIKLTALSNQTRELVRFHPDGTFTVFGYGPLDVEDAFKAVARELARLEAESVSLETERAHVLAVAQQLADALNVTHPAHVGTQTIGACSGCDTRRAALAAYRDLASTDTPEATE